MFFYLGLYMQVGMVSLICNSDLMQLKTNALSDGLLQMLTHESMGYLLVQKWQDLLVNGIH